MNAGRFRHSLFAVILAALFAGVGCQSARQINWAVGEREDIRDKGRELQNWPRTEWDRYNPTASELNDQRARNEAAFRAANPGAKR